MYIKKYWGSFIGGSDDSLNFQNLDEYNLSLIHISPFGGNAENGRSHPFPDSGDPASETLSPVTTSCAETTGSGWASFPLCPETL